MAGKRAESQAHPALGADGRPGRPCGARASRGMLDRPAGPRLGAHARDPGTAASTRGCPRSAAGGPHRGRASHHRSLGRPPRPGRLPVFASRPRTGCRYPARPRGVAPWQGCAERPGSAPSRDAVRSRRAQDAAMRTCGARPRVAPAPAGTTKGTAGAALGGHGCACGCWPRRATHASGAAGERSRCTTATARVSTGRAPSSPATSKRSARPATAARPPRR